LFYIYIYIYVYRYIYIYIYIYRYILGLCYERKDIDGEVHDDGEADAFDGGGGSKAKGCYEAALVLHGAASDLVDGEPEDQENGWEIAFSEDEAEEALAIFPSAVRVKDFSSRPEYVALFGQNLIEKPSAQGCFLAYHKESRTWQASYPDVPSMCCTHGGSTGRSAEYALLSVICRLLTVHCEKNKKDKLWLKQLEKVTAARDSIGA
jgi:hypothetical protein